MRATVFLLLALSACATLPSPSPFQEQLLATIPDDAELLTLAFTPDGREVAYIARFGDVYRAIRGTRKSPPFDGICCISISDDGKRAAFLANRQGAQVVVLDDSELKTYGRESSPGWPIAFSGNGTVMAYPLFRAKDHQGSIVVNGVEGPVFENVGWPALSRDGRVVAYRACRNDDWFIRIGDREEPSYDSITDPVVSDDGSTVAYAAENYGKWTLHQGSRTSTLLGMPHKIFISPDGRHVGWIDLASLPEGGSKMRVIVDGKPGEAFGIVGKPSFSPTESLAVYGAEEADRIFVVIGTRKFETPDRVGDPVFSPDGRKVGYGARIGRELWWKVIDVP
ncbi:MAG TPA: hypothetical protein VJU16_08950 [Planctomycetota bacterium]|nr:hypothetical protein [Planctomycetota bacterium]